MKKTLLFTLLAACALSPQAQEMTATLDGLVGTMSNGIITLNIDKSGRANKMYHEANGSANILGSSGIYFDYTADKNRALSPSRAEVVKLTDDYAEILYTNTADNLQFQHGYILRKGVSGVYCYVIANGTPTSSSVNVKEIRVCTRLASNFLNGYVDDVMQGTIPSNDEMKFVEDKNNNRTIQDATYEMNDGSIYTKYNWAQFIDSDLFHGLMNDKVGVWNIPVSYEWLNGGPMRQELTVHATGKSPITIQMIQGEHLGGAAQKYNDGEKQIFGPFFIYVNSGASKEEMIADARAKALEQQAQWPFGWFENSIYPLDRSTVSGRLTLPEGMSAEGYQMVLGEPSTEIIRQGKKYIYWAKTDAEGRFSIPAVRKGSYSLFAYATKGTVTEQFELKGVEVTDASTDLGEISWTPDLYRHELWNIGENNRRADGYKLSDAPRAYGLWEQVPADLTYTVGTSDPAEDWYYAQCKNGTWTVKFNADNTFTGLGRFTASMAGTTNKPKLKVSLNGTQIASWSLSNNDAAIYRSATQAGRHVVKSATFDASLIKAGENELTLTMSGISKNGGILYDCIKMEAQAATGETSLESVTAEAAGDYEIYNLSGMRVTVAPSLDILDLPAGIYIWCRGATTGKIAL